MTKVLLQPAANEDSISNYKTTVENFVHLKSISEFLSNDELEDLYNIYPNGESNLWGVQEYNLSRWKKIEKGDVTLFYKSKNIFSSAVVTYKLRNRELAEYLWGDYTSQLSDGDFKVSTWENIYFIDQIRPQEISIEDFNNALNYKKGYVIQGFSVLGEEKSSIFFKEFDLESFVINTKNKSNSFGHIEGYPEGSVFRDRKEIKSAGLHKYHVNGISRVKGVGCDCIVLNAGYIDDEDNGTEIIYTGEGGREGQGQTKHTFDQPFTKGNYDLSRNNLSGLPVRIIRGPKLRNSEYKTNNNYRYDGLYYVENYWAEEGKDGYRIWRYRLVKKDGLEIPKIGEINIPETNDNETKRKISQTNTIIRDPKIPESLKALYDCQCQVCGIRLEANGKPHAIGAHIKGLGKPNYGPDSADNMIILCPNCHYLFDQFAFTINDDFTFLGQNINLKNKSNYKLMIKKGHVINKEYINYHRDQYKLRLR